MFFRLVYLSLLRQRRRKLLAGISVALGMALVTSMLAVGSDVQDKMNQEIRNTAGANLVVYPQEDTLDIRVGSVDVKPASDGAFLKEADLINIKHIFWGHNILGYTPMLETQGSLDSGSPIPVLGTYFHKPVDLKYETFYTGTFRTHPFWQVEGAWPSDAPGIHEAVAGSRLAAKYGLKEGQSVNVSGANLKITGIASTGDDSDSALIVPLAVAQAIAGKPGLVRKVYVSALTKPEDEFARRDPKTMSPALLERWSCTPYANSIAFQIMDAIPGARAEQIRRIAQTEGILLTRISGLMWLVAIASLLAAVMAVASAMATAMLERRREIGLMKSMGADAGTITSLFLTENTILAILAGCAGYTLAYPLAGKLGEVVFHSSLKVQPVLFPFVLLLAIAVTLTGSILSLRSAVSLDPAQVLRGDAL